VRERAVLLQTRGLGGVTLDAACQSQVRTVD
jgi:hypothetical protein